MRLNISFEENELQDALQKHFADGTSVQQYVKGALKFFNEARKKETEGKTVGYGEGYNFSRYNTPLKTEDYL